MDLSLLTPYLDLIISNEDVQFSKPNPEMYQKTISKLSLQPHDCLIVEDNDHGVEAAIASGGHLLRVSNPDEVTHERIIERIKEIEN